MVRLVFYEKPGCATNARQKALLRDAGHVLTVRDLLAEPWSAGRLRSFFGDRPVAQWFNRAAPRVKSGEIDPQRCEPERALALMLADPLLIRRPLLEVEDWRHAGFDAVEIDRMIGLAGEGAPPIAGGAPLDGCARIGETAACPSP